MTKALRSCRHVYVSLTHSLFTFFALSLLHLLAENQDKDVRAATYRLLRHLIVDQDDIAPFRAARIDLYLIR